MRSFQIKLTTIDELTRFVQICQKFSSDIDAVSGRYIIDAKSIMGLMSVKLTDPIQVRIHDLEKEEEFAETIEDFLL